MIKRNRTILAVVRGGPRKGGLERWRSASVASCLGQADGQARPCQIVLEMGKGLRLLAQNQGIPHTRSDQQVDQKEKIGHQFFGERRLSHGMSLRGSFYSNAASA